MKDLKEVGVLIPTINSMPAIREHISNLNEWIELTGHVVVVDSQSTDGTLDYIKQHLKHPNVTYLSTAPGLYSSWNQGIGHIKTKYTYIATVGDTIPRESLQQLLDCAERTQVPVVVSPPNLVAEDGSVLESVWPIHRLIARRALPSEYRLTAAERLICSCLFLPKTLIGSSASNLYRTRCLQDSPFSSDYGHAGDSIWVLSRPLDEEWIILKNVKSKFVVHERKRERSASSSASRIRFYAYADQRLEELEAFEGGGRVARELAQYCRQELCAYWKQKEAVMVQFREMRKKPVPWFMYLQGWRLRRRKVRLRKKVLEIASKIFSEFGRL